MKQKTAHTSEAHDGARPGLAMTESGRRKPWSRRPSWLKEVLSKSGTELVAITAASKKNTSASSKSHKNEADSPSNMVYYQSMPLVVKTEQPQQQFCAPLSNGGDSVAAHPQQLPQQHFPQNCVLRSNTTPAAAFLHQQPTSSSIAHAPGHTAVLSSPFAATGVKTEPQLRAGMPRTYSEPSSSFEGGAPPPAPAATPLKPAASKPKFKCAQCGMTFGSKSAHTSHTKSHAKSEGASLEDAAAAAAVDLPLGIPKKPLLKAELGSGDPYRCNVCEKTFAVPARLIRHYRTHTGERPFECEWCHKLFSVKENLQVHRRIHTKERPYQCQVCERAFEHSGKLHRHNRIHTGERPHGCSLCDKTFIQSGQLVIHMRTHTGEKPYKCPVEGCGKGFTCSKQLKVHSRTHTGEKPYRCDICQREFGYNHVLKLHRMQHYGAKCYKCTICDDTFKSKKEMEAHIKRHANDLPDDGRREPAGASLSSSSSSSSSPGLPQSQSPSFSGQPQPQFATLGYPMKATSSKGDFAVAGDRVSPAAQSEAPSAGFAPAASPTLTMTNGYESERAVSSLLGYAMDTDAYERPTDLRVLQQQVGLSYSNSEQGFEPPVAISYSSPSSAPPTSLELHHRRHVAPERSINPALLEAASIAARMSQVNIVEEPQDAETQAALQIMQLHRSQQPQPQQEELQHVQRQHYDYDDTQEANQLIEHYKRGELATHGIHKGYAAPVPKFKSSLLNNEIIVRQVEAAIAPLRSSTESPERASSPDSDSNMLMADRDVMTLPLRKRKVYMSEGPRAKTPTTTNTSAVGANGTAAAGATTTQPMGAANVIRMSTVIQFAKAS